MGTNSSKKTQLPLRLEDWRKLNSTPSYDIMRNIDTGVIGELHHFFVPEDSASDCSLKEYIKRANTSSNFVKVYGTDINDEGPGLCGKRSMAKVMTERIPTRFADSKLLNREEEASVLYNALRGFGKLYNEHGPVDVNSRMFGYNDQGQLKCWMNENYGANYPS